MSLTYGQAKQVLSQYAGKGGYCPDTAGIDLFVHKVLQYMLFSGSYGNIRKFVFNAVNGCFTAPYELETPIKVKIGDRVGTVWDKWFEFHTTRTLDGRCLTPEDAMYEESNRYPTIYNLPQAGARVVVNAICEEDAESHLIVKGNDTTGREIFTVHQGKQIVGEFLHLRKGQPTSTTVVFGNISAIYKTKTNGYVQLFWVSPCGTYKGFLADYSPVEETPQYRRFRLHARHCHYDSMAISVLGRIRLKSYYADDDIIPFDNLFSLEVAGKAANKQHNDSPQEMQANDQFLQELNTRESEYKRVENGQPVEIQVLSPVRNIVGLSGRFFGRR